MSHENLIRHTAFEVYGAEPVQDPVLLAVRFHLPPPQSWSQKRTAEAIGGLIRHTKKPDLDNLAKTVKDALRGVVWRDDSQVVELDAAKGYGTEIGTQVTVYLVPGRRAP